MSAPLARRGFLAAFGSAIGAPARIALPVLAAPVVAALPAAAGVLSPPAFEAPLIEAGRRWQLGVKALANAIEARDLIGEAYREAMGPTPRAIIMDRPHVRMVGRVQTAGTRVWTSWYPCPDDPASIATTWTARGLRAFIGAWPAVNGRGGTTPKDLRRVKAILPAAEAWEARCARYDEQFGHTTAHDTVTAAREAVGEAEDAILALPAGTVAGVAVKARLAAYKVAEWQRETPGWTTQSQYLMAVVEAALAAGGEA